VQTFTKEEQLKNFPDSTLAPWELIEEWSTPSGCVGFSAVRSTILYVCQLTKSQVVPEMNSRHRHSTIGNDGD
jgi:hypothetical protein